MLRHMSAQDKICSAFAKSDQTLVEIHTVALYFGSDICQIKLGFVQVNTKSAWKMSDVRLLCHALHVHAHTRSNKINCTCTCYLYTHS